MILPTLVSQHNFYRVPPPAPGSNSIDFSTLRRADFSLRGRGYGIKFVQEGVEHYRLNGADYRLRPGQFLLVSPQSKGGGYIDSVTDVKGMCIHLTPALLREVAADPAEPDASAQLPAFAADFQESMFPTDASLLGRYLRQLAVSGAGGETGFQPEIFYRLAELYLVEIQNFNRKITATRAVKKATQKELYRRVLQGRSFLEDCCTQPIDIADAARSVCISEYQFFRLFKSVYGISPYQFLLQKRLERGRELLLNDGCSVSEAAFQTGFADIFSFSKAFKKRYGVSPSLVK